MTLLLTKISLFFSLIISMSSLYAEDITNELFTAPYKILNCDPSCDNHSIRYFSNIISLQSINQIYISIVDNVQSTVMNNATCDSSHKLFEFNMWLYSKNNIRPAAIIKRSNFDSPFNRERRVCDGQFSTNDSMALLTSSNVNIKLERNFPYYILTWEDHRLDISVKIHLERLEEY